MHEDGSELFLNSGDVYEIRPGHHAEVVGDIPCSMVEFNSEAAAQIKWLIFVQGTRKIFSYPWVMTPKG